MWQQSEESQKESNRLQLQLYIFMKLYRAVQGAAQSESLYEVLNLICISEECKTIVAERIEMAGGQGKVCCFRRCYKSELYIMKV